ncbi:MAG: hypothetical protein ABH859_02665 [Pseudomonadota bacterium]
MNPNEFAHELEKIFEDNLESVVLYGSAASTDFSKKLSDYNTIVVLKDPAPANLAKSGKLIRKWIKKGNPVPLFFDPKHIERSLDVFPLEFLDIKDRHKVLIGHDPFENIKVDFSNLRHQCETELKGKLLYLRGFYASNYDQPKLIAETMLKSFSAFVTVFRGVLHMLGETPDRDSAKVVEGLVKHIDFNSQIFMDLIAVRKGTSVLPRKEEALEAFEQYLTELETITSYVDAMNT